MSANFSGAIPYLNDFANASQSSGIPENVLIAQDYYESSFKPSAISPTGAFGISQFEPATAKMYGVAQGTSTKAVESQIAGQAAYDASLVKKFGNLNTALQAYNMGPGNVENGQTNSYGSNILALASQVPSNMKVTPCNSGNFLSDLVCKVTHPLPASVAMAQVNASNKKTFSKVSIPNSWLTAIKDFFEKYGSDGIFIFLGLLVVSVTIVLLIMGNKSIQSTASTLVKGMMV